MNARNAMFWGWMIIYRSSQGLAQIHYLMYQFFLSCWSLNDAKIVNLTWVKFVPIFNHEQRKVFKHLYIYIWNYVSHGKGSHMNIKLHLKNKKKSSFVSNNVKRKDLEVIIIV
jgi:hypothetical protein